MQQEREPPAGGAGPAVPNRLGAAGSPMRAAVLLVDAANVVGARPDGWWRDRPGAAARLMAALLGLRSATVEAAGRHWVIESAEVVLEGAATAAADPGWLRVHRAARGTSGDDVLVAVAAGLLAAGRTVLAVSADRGLRARWAQLPVLPGTEPPQALGPRWLLALLAVPPSHPQA